MSKTCHGCYWFCKLKDFDKGICWEQDRRLLDTGKCSKWQGIKYNRRKNKDEENEIPNIEKLF